jgi:transcriptional regulator GlxA family with amidase domain
MPKRRVRMNALIEDERVAFAIESVRDCGGDPSLSLRSLAEHVHLSPRRLSFLFKRQTQLNFRAFMRKVRIARAQALFNEGDASVKFVASIIGYKHASGLDRDFNLVYGVPAGCYKAKTREAVATSPLPTRGR